MHIGLDGVLFASFAMTDSEELAKKEIQGETYLDKIIFAKYEKYTKTAKLSTNIEINLLNVQKSQLYRDLVAWLKKQPFGMSSVDLKFILYSNS